MKELEAIQSHLTAAEAGAKQLADLNPRHGGIQALRARCHSALELCGSTALQGLKAAEQPAPKPAPGK